MLNSIVWVDREHAKVFLLVDGNVETQKDIHSTSHNHHTHRFDAFDRNQIEKSFFSEIVTHLSGISSVLLMGPGVGKYHFLNFLNEHHPAISKKITSCETVDHLTDGQIIHYSKRFFEKNAS